jgi:hypothetical protein
MPIFQLNHAGQALANFRLGKHRPIYFLPAEQLQDFQRVGGIRFALLREFGEIITPFNDLLPADFF